jgi:hypothetical protein
VLAEKLPAKPACGRDYSHAIEALLAYLLQNLSSAPRLPMGAAPVFLAAQSNATIAGACCSQP